MKKVLLFAAIAGIGSLTLSSYDNGPAMHGANYTGSPGSNGSSCGGGGCHGGASPATTVGIEVDSAGVAVNSYVPGMNYTIKITGGNTSNLPKFGFQFVSIKASDGSQAGTMSSLPSGVHSKTLSSRTIIEHSSPRTAAQGIYSISFTWTAPAAGTGDVHMFCTLNAVDGDGQPNASDVSANRNIGITEQTGGVGVLSLAADINVTAYPNPAGAQLNLKMDNAVIGTYLINVFDISGKRILTDNFNVGSSSFATTINTANWTPGYYSLQLVKDGAQRIIPVVKQ